MKILRNYTLVVDAQDVAGVVNALERAPVFSLDLETMGLDFKRHDIHGVALATADREFYVTLGAEKRLLELLPNLKSKPVFMHNGVFDMHFLGKYGVTLPLMLDTMVGQHLVDENNSLGLKSLARTKLGINDPLPDFQDLMGWAARIVGKKKLSDVTILDMPLGTVSEYAARDARLTFDLGQKTLYELDKDGLLEHFYNVEMPFLWVIKDIEETGFYIDQDKLAALDVEFQQKQAEALELFSRFAPGVNPNSDPQVREYLYSQRGFTPTRFTDSGKPSTDALSLARLLAKDTDGVVRALLLQSKYEKLINTYVRRFQSDVYDGRLYGNFNQTGTVTGRLSSSGPNLQNIPSQGDTGHKIKELFAAPDGHVFINCDYSQLELRVLAHYSKDENLLRAFSDNLDPHQMTVDRIQSLGYTISRAYAKRVNFGWAYGVGPRGLADQIEDGQVDAVIADPTKTLTRPSEKDTKTWLNGFEQAYPGAAKWKRAVLDLGRQLGYVRTIWGRRRHLPDLRERDRSLAGRAERQAVNSIIQGSSADIIKWSMLQIHPLLPHYGARITAQVHDELTFECPKETAKEFGDTVARIMRQSGEFFKLRVSLSADPGQGSSWADAKG